MELHDIVGKRIARDKATYDLLTERPYEQDWPELLDAEDTFVMVLWTLT